MRDYEGLGSSYQPHGKALKKIQARFSWCRSGGAGCRYIESMAAGAGLQE